MMIRRDTCSPQARRARAYDKLRLQVQDLDVLAEPVSYCLKHQDESVLVWCWFADYQDILSEFIETRLSCASCD